MVLFRFIPPQLLNYLLLDLCLLFHLVLKVVLLAFTFLLDQGVTEFLLENLVCGSFHS
jgi:hypothetical protein